MVFRHECVPSGYDHSCWRTAGFHRIVNESTGARLAAYENSRLVCGQFHPGAELTRSGYDSQPRPRLQLVGRCELTGLLEECQGVPGVDAPGDEAITHAEPLRARDLHSMLAVVCLEAVPHHYIGDGFTPL